MPPQHPVSLTVLVARLSEGLPLRENDGHNQILEGGDVEEGGVLIVLDVFGVGRAGHVQAVRGTGNVAGAAGDQKRDKADRKFKAPRSENQENLQRIHTSVLLVCFFPHVSQVNRTIIRVELVLIVKLHISKIFEFGVHVSSDIYFFLQF